MDPAIVKRLREKPLPKGQRRFIRAEKARLRRTYFTLAEQEAKIEELYQKILGLKKSQ